MALADAKTNRLNDDRRAGHDEVHCLRRILSDIGFSVCHSNEMILAVPKLFAPLLLELVIAHRNGVMKRSASARLAVLNRPLERLPVIGTGSKRNAFRKPVPVEDEKTKIGISRNEFDEVGCKNALRGFMLRSAPRTNLVGHTARAVKNNIVVLGEKIFFERNFLSFLQRSRPHGGTCRRELFFFNSTRARTLGRRRRNRLLRITSAPKSGGKN